LRGPHAGSLHVATPQYLSFVGELSYLGNYLSRRLSPAQPEEATMQGILIGLQNVLEAECENLIAHRVTRSKVRNELQFQSRIQNGYVSFKNKFDCPCSNPPGSSGQGCDNSSATGGATLSATGGTFVSSDSLEFHVDGATPSALGMLLQGTTAIPTGAVYGQGVRCVGGSIKRLGAKHASGGSMTIPDFETGDSQVTATSAAKGDLIHPGDSRYYLVYYRDPSILGGCPATSTFNCTQTGRVEWSP
jgi:hypothetical protein